MGLLGANRRTYRAGDDKILLRSGGSFFHPLYPPNFELPRLYPASVWVTTRSDDKLILRCTTSMPRLNLSCEVAEEGLLFPLEVV